MATKHILGDFETADDMLAFHDGLEAKFRSSCRQIVLLNNRIDDLQRRYDRALKSGKRCFRYSLRLSLATLEGLRNMFYEYARRRGEELDSLQDRLVLAGLISDLDGEEDGQEEGDEFNEDGDLEETDVSADMETGDSMEGTLTVAS